jgi:hypothetical protein
MKIDDAEIRKTSSSTSEETSRDSRSRSSFNVSNADDGESTRSV